MPPGPLALVGSGEYLPQMTAIEGELIAGRPPRYVQLATAAVPDGPDVVANWHRLGRAQAERLGVEAVVLDVTDFESANDSQIAQQVEGAGLIYLSGGNPSYLAGALRGSAVWQAITTAWQGGAALAGCSAGAMAMASRVPLIRDPSGGTVEGLAVLPHLRVLPHFDLMRLRFPDLLARFGGDQDDSVTTVGVDEDTAIVGGPYEWVVKGRSSAWLIGADENVEHPAGTTFTVPA